MYDLKLDRTGDLEISEAGDVMLTQSVRQAVEIRLRWLFGEWRYLERVMVKKPDIEGIKQILRQEIMAVDGMEDVMNLNIVIDDKTREAVITFDGTADGENFSEEVMVSV